MLRGRLSVFMSLSLSVFTRPAYSNAPFVCGFVHEVYKSYFPHSATSMWVDSGGAALLSK